MGLAILAAVSLSAQSQPTFYAAYEDGLEAVKQGHWRAAATAFQRALSLRPAPAARVFIYGNNLLKDYYPSSHLARCFLELGDREAAAAMLGQAESRGEPASMRDPVARRLQESQSPKQSAPPNRVESPAPAPSILPSPPVQPVNQMPPPMVLPGPLFRPATEAVPPAPATPVRPPPASVEAQRPRPSAVAPGPENNPVPPQAQGLRPLPRSSWALGVVLMAGLILIAWRREQSKRPPEDAGGPGSAPPADPVAVGPYRILGVLGQGGFATTYLARRGVTGREVAVKVLHPHRLRDPEFTKRFAQEARLGAILDHPNLVRLVDPGPPEGASWIALEYVPGQTLEARLKDGPPFPVQEAVEIALGIAKAMAYAHAHGVAHRDLKPGNVILSAQGPKVMDLGIARDLDAHALTTTYAFMGTPLYAAPEAQLQSKAGPAGDRYSLGVILFEMLTGAPPFHGETPFAILDQHRQAPVPSLPSALAVPPELARLLRRLLDKEPEQRPEDGELVAKLESILGPLTLPRN